MGNIFGCCDEDEGNDHNMYKNGRYDGQLVYGQLIDGKKTGVAMYKYADGTTYEGELTLNPNLTPHPNPNL
jgi:hypothetical protein